MKLIIDIVVLLEIFRDSVTLEKELINIPVDGIVSMNSALVRGVSTCVEGEVRAETRS